jgi:hypothetical protein
MAQESGNGICEFDGTCRNVKCIFTHPKGRGLCRSNLDCQRVDCVFEHSNDCKRGKNCPEAKCESRHPPGPRDIRCRNGKQCKFQHAKNKPCVFNHDVSGNLESSSSAQDFDDYFDIRCGGFDIDFNGFSPFLDDSDD